MALKIDAKFEKKTDLCYQNKNLKQLDLPDAVRKVILIWKLISTINKTFHICFTESFFKV